MTKLNPAFWQGKKITITGGHGFLGSHLVELLQQFDLAELRLPSHSQLDLRQQSAAAAAVAGVDVVIHMAANVGGIGYNQQHPGTLFYDNILMGTHIMEESRKAGVAKFVNIGTICAYPKHTPVPFREEDLWMGYPEETNAPYGLAKKMQLVQALAYRQQYGFNAIYILPVNLYGPRDNFNSESSHVIPALIKKCIDAVDAGEHTVVVWGTGKPTREFLYVSDAAQAIALATERYNSPEPINLGSHFEISIGELASIIADLVGFEGTIVFDATKPDGQPRRKLDVSKAYELFGFKSEVTFEDGLRQTIEWYRQQEKNS